MGVSYLCFTLNDETASWLRKNNFPLPSPLPESRFPTLGELKAVIDRLDGFTAGVHSSTATNTLEIEVVDRRGYQAGWSTTIWANLSNEKTRPPEDGDI